MCYVAASLWNEQAPVRHLEHGGRYEVQSVVVFSWFSSLNIISIHLATCIWWQRDGENAEQRRLLELISALRRTVNCRPSVYFEFTLTMNLSVKLALSLNLLFVLLNLCSTPSDDEAPALRDSLRKVHVIQQR